MTGVPAPSWAAAVYPAANRFVEQSLRNGASFVTSAADVWTPGTAEDFYDRFVIKEDLSHASFVDKLRGQLTGAEPETVLLATDLVALCTLPVHDIGEPTKRKRLEGVLSLLDDAPPIDPSVSEALSAGVASYGQGHTQIWNYMRYMAEFARTWAGLELQSRDRALGNAWEWKAFLTSLPMGAGAQTSALMHLVFPTVFEPIVSSSVKSAVVSSFASVGGVSDEPDVDRQLAIIREALAPVLGDFQFWDPRVQRVWQGNPTDPAVTFARFALLFLQSSTFEKEEIAYKLELAERLGVARQALAGGSDWLTPLKRAFSSPNNITSHFAHGPFLRWCEESPDAAASTLRTLWSDDVPHLEAFLSELPADVVGSPGEVANLAAYLTGARDPHTWINFKASFVDRALEISGYEKPDVADVLGRLERFAEFVDELRVRIVARGGPPTSRLQGQGMAWAVVLNTPPPEWDDADRIALEQFRLPREQGSSKPPGSVAASVPERAWLVRGANVGGENRVPSWLDEGYVSVGWPEMGELDSRPSLDELRDAAKSAYPDESPGAWGASAGNLYRFLSRISVGDLVVTLSADDVYVGRVDSDAYEVPVPHAGRRRKVDWLNREAPYSRTDILASHPSLYSKMRTLLTVTDLKEDVGAVRELIGLETDVSVVEFEGLPAATDELAASLYVPLDWVQRDLLDLLAEKRQLIFYGPPGTGKTYVAQRLAEHVVRNGGEFELVQFHPSYTYEDFFEGFRPAQADGDSGVQYELRPGPLKRIAALAAADPAHPYLLIVDEINRGNIPKIFGELLFLLEYRDRSIRLQYADEPFSLPPNLFVIGTMNTADRSIALVDAALRRRFFFVPFIPTEHPVDSVLKRWLHEQGLDDLPARLLDELNRRIAKDEIAIGPSYLMSGDGSEDSLQRIWRHAILPLLDEHFYGTKVDVHAELSFKACREAVVAFVPTDGLASDGDHA